MRPRSQDAHADSLRYGIELAVRARLHSTIQQNLLGRISIPPERDGLS